MATGPEHRVPVEILDATGDFQARAMCFFSSWTDEASGEPRWRGFLASIEPPGTVIPGDLVIRLESGATARVRIRDLRDPETRTEQAIFEGDGAPPELPGG